MSYQAPGGDYFEIAIRVVRQAPLAIVELIGEHFKQIMFDVKKGVPEPFLMTQELKDKLSEIMAKDDEARHPIGCYLGMVCIPDSSLCKKCWRITGNVEIPVNPIASGGALLEAMKPGQRYCKLVSQCFDIGGASIEEKVAKVQEMIKHMQEGKPYHGKDLSSVTVGLVEKAPGYGHEGPCSADAEPVSVSDEEIDALIYGKGDGE